VDYICLTGAASPLGRTFSSCITGAQALIPIVRSGATFDYGQYLFSSNIGSNDQIFLVHLSSATPSNVLDCKAFDFSVNLDILKNVVNALSALPAPLNVIFASSTSVYNPSPCRPFISEDYPLLACNGYGYSKLICERYLESCYEENLIHGYVSLRIPGILVPRPPGSGGNLVISIIDKMINNSQLTLSNPLCMFNSTIDAWAICSFVYTLIENNELPCTSINLAAYPPCQLSDIVQHIAHSLAYSANLQWTHSHRPCFHFDVSKSTSYGFQPPTIFSSVDRYINSIDKSDRNAI